MRRLGDAPFDLETPLLNQRPERLMHLLDVTERRADVTIRETTLVYRRAR